MEHTARADRATRIGAPGATALNCSPQAWRAPRSTLLAPAARHPNLNDFDADRLAEIDADLAPRLQLLRRPDSDIARIDVYARDGTLIAGDRPDRRGERVTADDAPLLAQALQGSVVAERTRLDQAENADLKPSLGEALEVYVPLVVDGQVVGAYEVYADLGPVLWLRSVLWALIVTFVVACGVGIVLVQRGRARGLAAGSSERVFGHARRGPALGAPSGAAPEASILSRREREVLCLLASTHSYREIAETLVLSEETVRTHVKNILRKLEQPERTQAVVAALQLGLLTLDPPPVRRAERPQ